MGINNNAPKEALDVVGNIYGSNLGILGGTYIMGAKMKNTTPTGTGDNVMHTAEFSTVTTAMTGVYMYRTNGFRLEQDLTLQGVDIAPLLSTTTGWYGSNNLGTTAQATTKGHNNTSNTNNGQVMGNGQDNVIHYALCPDGYIASGMEVRANTYYDGSMKLRCTQLATGWTTTESGRGVGSFLMIPGAVLSETHYAAMCPSGTFVKGVSVFAYESFSHNLKVYCTGIKRVP